MYSWWEWLQLLLQLFRHQLDKLKFWREDTPRRKVQGSQSVGFILCRPWMSHTNPSSVVDQANDRQTGIVIYIAMLLAWIKTSQLWRLTQTLTLTLTELKYCKRQKCWHCSKLPFLETRLHKGLPSWVNKHAVSWRWQGPPSNTSTHKGIFGMLTMLAFHWTDMGASKVHPTHTPTGPQLVAMTLKT